jgi:hypothetical protein
MIGVESCWCCPACNKPKTPSKSRRRERQVSFNSNSLSPSKRQAYSPPDHSDPKPEDEALEACPECEQEEEAHLTILLDSQVMCLRCQRKKTPRSSTNASNPPSLVLPSADMLAAAPPPPPPSSLADNGQYMPPDYYPNGVSR